MILRDWIIRANFGSKVLHDATIAKCTSCLDAELLKYHFNWPRSTSLLYPHIISHPPAMAIWPFPYSAYGFRRCRCKRCPCRRGDALRYGAAQMAFISTKSQDSRASVTTRKFAWNLFPKVTVLWQGRGERKWHKPKRRLCARIKAIPNACLTMSRSRWLCTHWCWYLWWRRRLNRRARLFFRILF